MIMGDICTRACGFCNVETGKPRPSTPPSLRVAEAVAKMGLKHVVVTSVDRDDLADGGAEHFAQTIRRSARRRRRDDRDADARISCASPARPRRVIAARPDVFNHNLETVPRLYLRDPARARATSPRCGCWSG